jgi:hypothetical protein
LPEAPPDLDERLLQRVLRDVLVSDDSADETEEHGGVSFDQLSNGLRVVAA